MRLIAFVNDAGQPALGARIGADQLVDLTAAGLPATLDELLRQGERARRGAPGDAGTRTMRRPLAGLR